MSFRTLPSRLALSSADSTLAYNTAQYSALNGLAAEHSPLRVGSPVYSPVERRGAVLQHAWYFAKGVPPGRSTERPSPHGLREAVFST